MEEIKDQETELFGVVNRNKTVGSGYFSKKRNHGRYLILSMLNMLMDILGYIGLGAAMVAALVLGLAPSYLTIPVSLFCCMWVAVRLDRFFRR